MTPVALSVVIPVYGCAQSLRPLLGRLRAALDPVEPDWELVLVDDRSRDGAWAIIGHLAAEEPRVRGVRLSRNFGQHAAITAGLAHARGAAAVVMDCDLQEPPEAIPELLVKAAEGYDIVHTRRRAPLQSPLRRAAGRAYFRLRNWLSQSPMGLDHGTMSLLSRRAVDAFLSLRDQHREYLAMLSWLGFEQATIEVDHADRHAGESAYSLRALASLAVDGVVFQTTRLLRWIIYAGFAIAAVGLLLALYNIVLYFTADAVPAGYTSLAVLVLLMSGAIIVSVGVTGLYVGKTFEQVKGRPLYVVEEELDGVRDERSAEASTRR